MSSPAVTQALATLAQLLRVLPSNEAAAAAAAADPAALLKVRAPPSLSPVYPCDTHTPTQGDWETAVYTAHLGFRPHTTYRGGPWLRLAGSSERGAEQQLAARSTSLYTETFCFATAPRPASLESR